MWRAERRDKNEREIVDALDAVGATVSRISATGLPDLVVGYRGENHLIEVKGKTGRLTKAQKEWHTWWRGKAHVVRSAAEALRAIGACA